MGASKPYLQRELRAHLLEKLADVEESTSLLRQEIMPPLVDLEAYEMPCPYLPRICDTDCGSWRGQQDGFGYCSRTHGDWGNRV